MTAKDFSRSASGGNKKVNHPLQAFEWGEFRKKTGVKVIRGESFQLTIHKIPHINFNIGYLPKGNLPDKKLVEELRKIGKENNCIFIQLEPNTMQRVILSEAKNLDPSAMPQDDIKKLGLAPAAHPLFTKYTFQLDLTKSEEELLKSFHPKTRYNIRVAEKHGVEIVEDNSEKAFAEYLRLTEETTKRQKFYAHTKRYHELMWQALKPKTNDQRPTTKDQLTAHLLLAKYKPKSVVGSPKTLVAWILFVFKDTLYYPYGASSDKHRETMASNLIMWETIKFGKKLGLKKFDMWGALGSDPNPKDPWYGFHRFKLGYGADLIEFVGSYDLVINPILYNLYKLTDKIRWLFLRMKS